MIYLDNAATTLPAPEVVAAMADCLARLGGNPSSQHALGREANRQLIDCRETIARALGAEAADLHFTSGGTEADNWAVYGAAHAMRHRGRHIVTTAIEHDAVLAPVRDLESRGYDVTYLQPDSAGQIHLPDLQAALREDTVLVSVMLVNNETGAHLPVREMAEAVHAHSPALFHTDAIQGFLKVPCTPGELGVDLISISAHKLHGPKGVGALWVRPGVKLPPLIRGGGQESGLRSGTEALHNITGFAKAVELAHGAYGDTRTHLETLQAHIRRTLPQAVPEARLLPQGAPHILSLSLPGWKSEVIMNFLDGKQIAVSHSSACKKGGRSHVLAAMGLPNAVIDGTIRVSFSRETTAAELDQFVDALAEARETLFPVL